MEQPILNTHNKAEYEPAHTAGFDTPFGKGRAVLDSYKDIYTHKLESVADTDIHFWHGSKESFVAKPQVRHLRELHPDVHVEVFEGMNHGQLLADRPQDVAARIIDLI
ncbi:MAG: hypothetical protein MJZ09_09280 [Bacteroidales bacterium]|nr:hypothetical protein [Bacteroidales bacterium]